jgi:3-deoxy-D-manno-octulosonate 8-phosphate phosphatase (KDO 8-P phosphatase)
MQAILQRAKNIQLVIFDVDGVLTNGQLFLGDDGQEYKAFHSRDGHGMKILQNNGITVAVITGRTSHVVKHRMKNLNIEHVYQGQLDKLPAYTELLGKLRLTPEQVAYVGDDVVDLPVMRKVGLAIAVYDAHPFVIEHAHWQTPHSGGFGAARDVCELLLKAHGHYDSELQKYL